MSNALSTLQRALDVNTPTIIWGPPGIGKTDRISQEAARRDWHMETVISSVRQPDDFAGLPHITDDGVILVPPDWGKRLATSEAPSILFLDEISCAAPATQGALLRVVLERVVGDLKLPDNVRVIAAANPPEQAAGGWDLSLPLANRFLHINWPAPTVSEWSLWAMSKVARLPSHGASRIAAFLSRRPELLIQVPESETEGGGAWPSPRSWALAARLLGDGGIDRNTLIGIITGTVGEAPAIEFADFDQDASQLRDPEELLANPESWCPSPERLDLVFTSMHAVAHAVTSDLTPPRWDAAWKLLDQARDVAADSVLAVGSVLARSGLQRSDLMAPLWLRGMKEDLDELDRVSR